MTAQQIQLVQQSWEKIKPASQEAGELFYKKLFERAPQVRHLFSNDVTEQAGRLTYMLTYVVSRLDKLDTILEDVQRLAERHNKYGAEPKHYMIVGECLLATLKSALGKDWNYDMMEAWATAYDVIATAMIQAQEDAVEKRA